MSSFILEKKEFIKAAGIMCGIEESKCDKHQYFIDNVKRRFEECYELNVDSFNEQYGDHNTYDNCAYKKPSTNIGQRVCGYITTRLRLTA